MTDESKKWSDISGPDRPLREFLYLDFNRITSYLSQLQDGLTQYYDRIKESDVKKGGPSASAQLGGNLYPITVKLERNGAENQDSTTTVQRQILHHAALGALESILTTRSMIGDPGSGKPFIRITGYPFLVNFQRTVQSTKYVTDSPVVADQKTEEQAFQERVVYGSMENQGKRLDLYYYQEKIAGTLQRDSVLVDTETFEITYGIPVRVATTMLALDMTGTPSSIRIPEGNGHIPTMAMHFQQIKQDNFGQSEGYDIKHQTVVPIAVYVDIFATNTEV